MTAEVRWFERLVALARAGRLSEARDGDPSIGVFLDRFGARISTDVTLGDGGPVATLLSCATEDDGPVGAAAAAWLARTAEPPPFLRRRTRARAEPGLVLRAEEGADAYALDADAAGNTVVVVDHGRWPDGHAILVFDVAARTCRRLRGDDRKWGTGVAVAGDGTWAVVTGGRKPLVVDLVTGEVTALPKGHRADAACAAITGADTFVTGGKDGALHHWNRAGKKLASAPRAHSSYLMGLRVRGAEVWSAGFDSTIRVWRLPGLTPVQELPSQDGWRALPLADGDVVTGAGRLAPDGALRYALDGTVAVDETGNRLYVGNDAGIHVHDLATGERLGTRLGLRPQAMLHRAGHLFVVERYHRQLHVLPVGALLGGDGGGEVTVQASFLAASPDGSRVVAVERGGGGRIEVERGGRLHHGAGLTLCDADARLVASLPEAQSPFAFAGELLLARTEDGAARAWGTGDGAPRWTLPGLWPERMVKSRWGRPCAAPVGEALALIAARDGDQEGIDWRDPGTGSLRAGLGAWATLRALFAEGGALWFSSERSVGRVDGGAITWEVPVNEPRSLRVRGGDVFVIEGATIRHLAAADGADRGLWKGRFKKPLECLAIDDDGRVWSGGRDGRLRAWEPARGAELAQAEPGGGQEVWHVRAGGGLVHVMTGRWAHAVLDAHTLRTVAEPWGTLTELELDGVAAVFPEGTYRESATAHDLRTGRVVRWVADRANLTVAAHGRRIWLAQRMVRGPLDVLDWVGG